MAMVVMSSLFVVLYLGGWTFFGLENLFARTDKLARATRAGVKALGLELLAPESPSDACTAIMVPEGIDGAKIPTLIRDV